MDQHQRQQFDAVVIGAGVIGSSVALELARRGRSVLVVDKGPAAGAGSTSSSSAIVRFHYSTLDAVALAWESVHLWQRWEEHLGVADESGYARFHRTGMLAIDAPDREAARKGVLDLFDQVGVPYEVFDPDALAARFPGLDVGRFFPPRPVADAHFADDPWGRIDAYFTPDAGFVDDPQLAAHNLMTAAKAHGAVFRFRTCVAEVCRDATTTTGVLVQHDDGTTATVSAPVVVNCAGPFSAQVNRMAGVLDDFAVGTRAMRQEVHVTPAPEAFALGTGGTIVSDPDLGTYFRPQPGGTILVGGVEPECDPFVWIDDADVYDPNPSVDVFEAQVYRLARRVKGLSIPHRPVGLAALYDVTPDWMPIYDRTALDGFYVAIGTSGNQFKNAPMSGIVMAHLIDACQQGHDHDRDPVRVPCAHTGGSVDLAQYSRRREVAITTNSVLG